MIFPCFDIVIYFVPTPNWSRKIKMCTIVILPLLATVKAYQYYWDACPRFTSNTGFDWDKVKT